MNSSKEEFLEPFLLHACMPIDGGEVRKAGGRAGAPPRRMLRFGAKEHKTAELRWIPNDFFN